MIVSCLININPIVNPNIVGYREKLFYRCKQLKREGKIKDVFTDQGDIKIVLATEGDDKVVKSIWTDKDLDKIIESES